MKPKCIIMDVDGVIADSKEMVMTCFEDGHLNREKANDLVPTMKVHPWADFICNMAWWQYELFIVTARRDTIRGITTEWLKNNNIFYTELFMKPEKVNGKSNRERDEEYKLRTIKKLEEKYEILFIVDDSPKVVNTLRDAGYWVLQPNNLYKEEYDDN